MHHVLVKQGDEEVLRLHLGARGEVLPVFSAGWAARAYVLAVAPGGGWYARACAPDDLISLLAGPCAGVEWVALDPAPGHRGGGEASGMMPHANFVDYLSCSGGPSSHRLGDVGSIGGAPHEREKGR